jgi:hypothetical protein
MFFRLYFYKQMPLMTWDETGADFQSGACFGFFGTIQKPVLSASIGASSLDEEEIKRAASSFPLYTRQHPAELLGLFIYFLRYSSKAG